MTPKNKIAEMRAAESPLKNAESFPLERIPELAGNSFRETVSEACKNGCHLSAFFAVPVNIGQFRLYAILDHSHQIHIFSTSVQESLESITPECKSAHWFEREIAEQWGLRLEHHPWLKPIRFHPSYTFPRDAWNRQNRDILPSVTNFYQLHGEEIHEVAVGPVHAGIIEPGHFRFQCHGEKVLHLEISLGYQHRGIERSLQGGPDSRSLAIMETVAGDTSIGHAIAYSQSIESLSCCEISPRAHAIRTVALELERLANHVGDLGALANDIGYLPTASYCGRLRGDFLNLTALVCGSRFGRGLVCPGGIRFDLEQNRASEMARRLSTLMPDVRAAIALLWSSSSVIARFENTGVVSKAIAHDLGLVGPAARASGISRDVRNDFPLGPYEKRVVQPAIHNSGDVYARAWVRAQEIERSAEFIKWQLATLPKGDIYKQPGTLARGQAVISFVEGWRGQICHVAITGLEGRLTAYKIVDPSFYNWAGLSAAMCNQEISDFPLCNKSFNLSYCGHDL